MPLSRRPDALKTQLNFFSSLAKTEFFNRIGQFLPFDPRPFLVKSSFL